MTNMKRWLEAGRDPRRRPPARPAGARPRPRSRRGRCGWRRWRGEAAAGGLRYSATIQPYEQVPLAFKVGGYVREVRPACRRRRPAAQPAAGRRWSRAAPCWPASTPPTTRSGSTRRRPRSRRRRPSLAKARADADAGGDRCTRARPSRVPTTTRPPPSLAVGRGPRRGQRAPSSSPPRSPCATPRWWRPADGVVLSRSVEVGTLASAGTVGFTLADLTRVKAVFGVPDRWSQRVPVGAPLQVTSDAFPGVEFPGRVTAVSPSADAQSRVFSVEVTIPNADRRLKAGMIATVEVAPAERARHRARLAHGVGGGGGEVRPARRLRRVRGRGAGRRRPPPAPATSRSAASRATGWPSSPASRSATG